MHTAIEFENVSYSRDDFQLNNMSFQIEKGKKYAIVGASGSGKSTILKLIMGFLSPINGMIKVDGQNINDINITELIAYIDQAEHIYKANLEENITVFHSYSILEETKLFPEECKLFRQVKEKEEEKNCQCFSGGEKQAIGFMRAWNRNADVILMDEPFSAMDIETRRYLEKMVLTSAEFEKKTVVMVTHDVEKILLENFDEVIYVSNSGIIVRKH